MNTRLQLTSRTLLLAPVLVFVVALIGLGGCDSGGSGAGTTIQTQLPVTPPPPQGVSAVAVTSPTSFTSSPVRISFNIFNFSVGAPGSSHLRFTIDGGPSNDFYVGTGNDPDIGVQRGGIHTHDAHWVSANSFDLFGLAAGSHAVRLALVDGSNTELSNVEAKQTFNFTVQQPPAGELQLEEKLGGLNGVVAMAQASDGRIFFNERGSGDVRVINPDWQLVPTPFCRVSVQTIGEQGLLGLALDPNFSSNQSLYVYYTLFGGTNRVSRLTNSGSGCSETVILDGLPTSGNHNGGIITFGPDGMLYVVIGDAENPSNAQNRDLLAGKVLRVTSNGAPAPGNPFSSTSNAQKVYSYGHRNSFGMTFHPSTGVLWESENGLSDFDEVNRITSGGNYGWDSSLQSGFLNRPCCINPIIAFPIIAPTGIVGIPTNSSVYPTAYRGNLLVAAYIDGTLRLVVPNGSNQDAPGTSSLAYTGGVGGLLSVMLGADGYVYTTNGGAIYRVVPH